jgi:phosphonate degradation associated HDIG domain protein
MPPLDSLEALERLYAERGGDRYGEGVTQIEHALQCATLAETSGAAPSLIAAALLHDVGHLLQGEASGLGSQDLRHEITGAQALRRLFGPAVRRPIALHVAAKRYLCFADPAYSAALSPASQISLALQGGPFDAVEAEAFERTPHWRDSVALRLYDDAGKSEDAMGRDFGEFRPLLMSLMHRA